jgi:hypothetical protein
VTTQPVGRQDRASFKFLKQIILDNLEYLNSLYALSSTEGRSISALLSCGTIANGETVYCIRCKFERRYKRCGNRSCEYCARSRAADWLARQERVMPSGISYIQITFKGGALFGDLLIRAPGCKTRLYNMLFRAVRKSIQRVQGKRNGRIGALLVLQAFSEAYTVHPHVHAVVPALVESDGVWVPVAEGGASLLPEEVLRSAFREALVKELRAKHSRLTWDLDTEPTARYLDLAVFEAEVVSVVGAKADVERTISEKSHLHLLGYVRHESALTCYEIKAYDGQTVQICPDGGTTINLEPREFLKRVMPLLVPPHFRTRRAFGILGNRTKGPASAEWDANHPHPPGSGSKGKGGGCHHQWTATPAE